MPLYIARKPASLMWASSQKDPLGGELKACYASARRTKDLTAKPKGLSELCERKPLTIYKEFVDISKYYGINASQLSSVSLRLEKQKQFLETTYLQNYHTDIKTSLKDVVISPNHNPQRYLAQINNRINTLEREAKQNGLKAVFLTITLPSEFHPMKQNKAGMLISNKKFNGVEPKEAVKFLTKMFTRLRHDRSLKELTKSQRIYYRVNEPHKDGTPHTHILLFLPPDRIQRVEQAFKRLFNTKTNKFEKDIRSATAYVMKYINKVLPSSKERVSEKEAYLNAWYSHHCIYRFSASRSLAPMYLYKMLYNSYSLFELTQVRKSGSLTLLIPIEGDKIAEIWNGDDLLYVRDDNFELLSMSTTLQRNRHFSLAAS